jgi:hypothetical protein
VLRGDAVTVRNSACLRPKYNMSTLHRASLCTSEGPKMLDEAQMTMLKRNHHNDYDPRWQFSLSFSLR